MPILLGRTVCLTRWQAIAGVTGHLRDGGDNVPVKLIRPDWSTRRRHPDAGPGDGRELLEDSGTGQRKDERDPKTSGNPSCRGRRAHSLGPTDGQQPCADPGQDRRKHQEEKDELQRATIRPRKDHGNKRQERAGDE